MDFTEARGPGDGGRKARRASWSKGRKTTLLQAGRRSRWLRTQAVGAAGLPVAIALQWNAACRVAIDAATFSSVDADALAVSAGRLRAGRIEPSTGRNA